MKVFLLEMVVSIGVEEVGSMLPHSYLLLPIVVALPVDH